MNKTIDRENEHVGTPRHSGRYPWGSGENEHVGAPRHSGRYPWGSGENEHVGAPRHSGRYPWGSGKNEELVMYFQKFTKFDFYASSFAVDQYLKAYDLQPETVLFIDTNLQSFLKYICLFIDNVLCIDGSVHTSYKVRFVEPADVNFDDIRRLTTL